MDMFARDVIRQTNSKQRHTDILITIFHNCNEGEVNILMAYDTM